MCGRYYIDDEMAREIERLLRRMDAAKGMDVTSRMDAAKGMDVTSRMDAAKGMDVTSRMDAARGVNATSQMKLKKSPGAPDRLITKSLRPSSGDIHPSELAPVITGNASGLHLEWQRWGLPGFTKGGVIFNARAETAMEKRMFQDGVLHRRVVIPARWFYEWNRAKEKITFLREDHPVLYMAGFYNLYEDGPHFVILTTEANASMKSTHDRMPLILEQEELVSWLTDDIRTRKYLTKTPVLLSKQAEYEQESFQWE